ncbi:MAG: ParB/RepB/Spo0J family partition protein [Christensenellaceae bacterium]|nr:ParB/RepB/Spo0J family partition protein [Christensenellaceae bacterium]
MAKNRIGKGLGALMGATIDNSIFDENKETAEKTLKEEYKEADKELEIKKIHTARAQARMEFDEDKLEELASSIREHGVLQPLLVRETDGKIELIAGERRLRAAKKAGLKKVPVIYLTADHDKAAEMGLIENIQREDLNAMEEAAAYREMIDVHHHTQETLSKVLGKSRSYVANTLRLLTLDEQTKEYIKTGKLTAGHGRALLSVKAEPRRQQLLEKILKDELSVRQAEDAAKALNEVSVKKEKSVKETADPFYREMENKLRDRFQTKIKITGNAKGGKIELSYHNTEELERLLDMMIEMEQN